MTRNRWLVIGALAFAVRMIAAVTLDAFQQPQVFEYDAIARSIVAGNGFVFGHLGVPYYSYSPPLYPWICAGLYWLTDGAMWPVLLLQMAVSAGHVVLIGLLAGRLFGTSAALASTLLLAFHPGLVVYSAAKAHPLTFDAFFFTAILWCFLELRDRPVLSRAVCTGIMIGLGTLSRATALVFLAIGSLWLLWLAERDRRSKTFQHVAAVAVCATLLVGPWALRNTWLHGTFVFQVTTDSEVFWRGNNPAATGHSYVNADRTVLEQLSPTERSQLYGFSGELQQAHWFRDRALAFIAADRAAFVRLAARKFVSFWWFAPQTGVRYPGWWRAGYQVYYVPVLILACVGFGAVMTRGAPQVRRDAILIGLFLLSLSALQSVYYVEGRHRWAVEPLMIVFASGGVAALMARDRHGVARVREVAL